MGKRNRLDRLLNRNQEAEARRKAIDALPNPPPQAGQLVAQSQTVIHAGPLPDPDTLQRYNEIVPGAASEIIQMGKAEQRHRHWMDLWEVAYGFMGMIFALCISLAGLASGVHLALNDHSVVGTLLGGGTIASIVGAFLYGRNRQNQIRPSSPE